MRLLAVYFNRSGFGLPGCSECPVGTYSNVHSYCKPCDGPHETSPAGASAPGQCTCAPGYGGAECSECGAGYFSKGFSRAPCEPCGEGFTSQPRSPAAGYCTCPAGQGVLLAGDSISRCQACPPNTYKPGPLLTPLSEAQPPAMALKAEMFGEVEADAPIPNTCLACPDGQISLLGAESADDCCKCGLQHHHAGHGTGWLTCILHECSSAALWLCSLENHWGAANRNRQLSRQQPLLGSLEALCVQCRIMS